MQTLNRKRAIIDRLLQSAVTNSEYDRAQVVLLLQVARLNGFYDEALKTAMKHRSEWLDWLTVSQRRLAQPKKGKTK